MKLTQTKIQQLTGCSDTEYAEVLFNTGIACAEAQVNDDALVSALTNTASFWQWYKMQFAIVDEVFCAAHSNVNLYDAKVRNRVKKEWIESHKQQLVSRPTSKVYSDAQKNLIKAKS